MSRTLGTQLAMDALKMAIARTLIGKSDPLCRTGGERQRRCRLVRANSFT
jgi:hypothetical protein